jgi:hypothetical protein
MNTDTDNKTDNTNGVPMPYVITPNKYPESSTWEQTDAKPEPGQIVMPFVAFVLETSTDIHRACTSKVKWNETIENLDDYDGWEAGVIGDLPDSWMDPETVPEPEPETVPVSIPTTGKVLSNDAMTRRTSGGGWDAGYSVHPDDEEGAQEHANILESMGLEPAKTWVPMGQTLLSVGLDAFHAKRQSVEDLPRLGDCRDHINGIIRAEERQDNNLVLADLDLVADSGRLLLHRRGSHKEGILLEPAAFNSLRKEAGMPNLSFCEGQDARTLASIWAHLVRQGHLSSTALSFRTRKNAEGMPVLWAVTPTTYAKFDSNLVMDSLVRAYGADVGAAVTYDGHGVSWEIRDYNDVPPVVGEVYGMFLKGSTKDGSTYGGINVGGGLEQAICWNLTTFSHELPVVQTRHRGTLDDIAMRLEERLRGVDCRHLFDRFRISVEKAQEADAISFLNIDVSRTDKADNPSLISRRLVMGVPGRDVLRALLNHNHKTLGRPAQVMDDLEACAESESVDLDCALTLFELNRVLNRTHERERIPAHRVAAFENTAGRVLSLANL